MLPAIVHVSGFGRTGSSAVMDALLDTRQFLSLKGKSSSVSESRVFGGRPDIPSFIARTSNISADDIVALWTNAARTERVEALSPRVRSFVERTRHSHAINAKFLRTTEPSVIREGAKSMAAALATTESQDERRSTYMRVTYETIRAAFRATGLSVLIDNDPTISPRIPLHLEQTNVRFVAVVRRPADVYVDRRRTFNPDESSVRDVFRTSLSASRRLRDLHSLARIVERQHPALLVVEFERFAHDEQYRSGIVESIAGGMASRPTEERFEPARAQKSIGIRPQRRDLLARSIFAMTLQRAHGKLVRLGAGSISRVD